MSDDIREKPPVERTLEEQHAILQERYNSVVEGSLKLNTQLAIMQRQARIQQQQIDTLTAQLHAAQAHVQQLANADNARQQENVEEIKYLRSILQDAGIPIPDRVT